MTARKRSGRLTIASSLLVIAPAFLPAPANADRGDVADRPGFTSLVTVTGKGRPAYAAEDPTWNGTRDHLIYCKGAPTPDWGMAGADITPNGRWVAFVSLAPLVADDTNRACDIYVADRAKGKIVRASVASDGAQALRPGPNWEISQWPSLSNNGRFVAFASGAPNLVPGDTNNNYDVFIRDLRKGTTSRVSVDSQENQGTVTPPSVNASSYGPSISGDGKRVAFNSAADNLDKKDSNILADTFLRDIRKGTTKRIAVYGETPPSMSRDGRFVVFFGTKTENQATEMHGIFRYEIATGKRELVVPSPVVTNPEKGCVRLCVTGTHSWGGRQISDDGRHVVFWSDSARFVPADRNSGACTESFGRDSLQDVFVKDLKTDRIERVSVASTGEEARWGGPTWYCNGSLGGPSISGNGRFVSFTSFTNFSSGDSGNPWCEAPCDKNAGDADAFVYDRKMGSLNWISGGPGSSDSKTHDCWGFADVSYADPSNPPDPSRQPASFSSALSGTGRYALFASCADNLVKRDRNREWDFFVRDLGPELGVGGFRSGKGRGHVSVPSARQFETTGVIKGSDPDEDVHRILTDQGANLIGASLAYRPQREDLFVREQLEDMPNMSGSPVVGNPAIVYGLDVTAKGTRYQVRVQRDASNDATGTGAFFDLFRCNGQGALCTQIAVLKGGYGTTGDEVVFSIPLDAIGLADGGTLRKVEAFTAVGTRAGVTGAVLDRVELPNGKGPR